MTLLGVLIPRARYAQRGAPVWLLHRYINSRGCKTDCSLSSQKVSPAPIKALTYPEPPTFAHDSLFSFLRYAEESGLSAKSTVYVGTRYEYLVAQSLADYGFYLRRVGGASDRGIDLLGTWSVPSTPEPIRVVLQCKAMASKLGPQYVRELEGAFVGAPAGWRGAGVMGLLVGHQPATKGVRESLGRSRWPMGYVACSLKDGQPSQMLWNRSAIEQGLDGMGVAVKYDSSGASRLTLTMNGLSIPRGHSSSLPPPRGPPLPSATETTSQVEGTTNKPDENVLNT